VERDTISELMSDLANVLFEIRETARLNGGDLYLLANRACLLENSIARLLAETPGPGSRGAKRSDNLVSPRGKRIITFDDDPPNADSIVDQN
jgi:hypothetical protein